MVIKIKPGVSLLLFVFICFCLFSSEVTSKISLTLTKKKKVWESSPKRGGSVPLRILDGTERIIKV